MPQRRPACRPQLAELEPVIAPAFARWPLPAGVTWELAETWGQYQSIAGESPAVPGGDANIHGHEGGDIDVVRDTPVYAPANGKVLKVNQAQPYKGTVYHYFSSVTLLDTGDKSGWTFKHITPNSKLKSGQEIAAGDLLGTVAPLPDQLRSAGLHDHLHIDRGKQGPGVPDLIDPAGTRLKSTLIRTNSDPRVEFEELMSKDKAGDGPTIVSADFRVAADDKLGTTAAGNNYYFNPLNPAVYIPAGRFGLDEKPRDSAHYFKETARVNGETMPVLGQKATAKAPGGTISQPGRKNGNIDIVVRPTTLTTARRPS